MDGTKRTTSIIGRSASQVNAGILDFSDRVEISLPVVESQSYVFPLS